MSKPTLALTSIGGVLVYLGLAVLGWGGFDAFFAKFEFKLALDYGADRMRRPATGSAVVTRLAAFCKQQVRC